MRRWATLAFLSASLWFACESLGGLAFLAAGVRLWSYHVTPFLWGITSPTVWAILFVGMPPFMLAFEKFERRSGWTGPRLAAARAAFLMIVGPPMELFVNESIFRGLLGSPLYTYEVLPTFGGSGSWLSPLYYLTLYPHFPLADFLRGNARLETSLA